MTTTNPTYYHKSYVKKKENLFVDSAGTKNPHLSGTKYFSRLFSEKNSSGTNVLVV